MSPINSEQLYAGGIGEWIFGATLTPAFAAASSYAEPQEFYNSFAIFLIFMCLLCFIYMVAAVSKERSMLFPGF
jgi:hypothetical protein